ncbi:uncharacterized protein Dwil_GK27750 [Drosophila willistoni]|uniref:Peptidase S1 domain-containing protein n=1 Tax=Drosophila willistoni TaxID=7260 RepID=A0A0Q9WNQ4_DROWI|nr:transmembrane protease serine 5 [Drosophila willistoni]KRF97472.1 uncharacterized protein Dwil_GK27750 [Drosophila willistoni]
MWSSKSVVPSLCLILIICSSVEVLGIIGGRYARLGMFPHHVSLHVEETYIAGGSLVSELFVLTCAHCILDDINTYTVLIGVVDLKDTAGQTFLPKEFILHPYFNPISMDYDIGLIRLSRPAIIDEKVQIIALAPGDAIYPEDTLAIVTGYGDIDPYKTRQNCLKYVYVPIWGPEFCNSSHYDRITDHGMVCAGDDDGGDNPCPGDSGGGLVVNHILIGSTFTMWSFKSVVPSLRLLLIMCSAAEVIGIIGGRFARLGMFPHHVSLHVEETYFAGGSLVSELFVLTCAHCILHDINSYTVTIGIVDLKDTAGQTFLPKEFIVHPRYDHETFDYDIGLIRLSRPAIIDEKVQIIAMAPGNAIYPKDTLAITTGFGDIDPYKTRQDCLKYAYVPLWGPERCNSRHFISITSHGMICAGDEDGRDNPCNGDSGGGLIVDR